MGECEKGEKRGKEFLFASELCVVCLVDLVDLVGLVYLVDLVDLVYLVGLVGLVCLVRRYFIRPEIIFAVLSASL